MDVKLITLAALTAAAAYIILKELKRMRLEMKKMKEHVGRLEKDTVGLGRMLDVERQQRQRRARMEAPLSNMYAKPPGLGFAPPVATQAAPAPGHAGLAAPAPGYSRLAAPAPVSAGLAAQVPIPDGLAAQGKAAVESEIVAETEDPYDKILDSMTDEQINDLMGFGSEEEEQDKKVDEDASTQKDAEEVTAHVEEEPDETDVECSPVVEQGEEVSAEIPPVVEEPTKEAKEPTSADKVSYEEIDDANIVVDTEIDLDNMNYKDLCDCAKKRNIQRVLTVNGKRVRVKMDDLKRLIREHDAMRNVD